MSSAAKIQIKAFDDLFGGSGVEQYRAGMNRERQAALNDVSLNTAEAVEIPLDELHPFKNHPFIVRDDEKMVEMVKSIRQVGILNPAIARKDKNGGYELISGHTRKEAARRAGLATMPVIVRDYDDSMSTIAMVDANLQREELFISEKAKAYAMRYEAMKHPGVGTGEKNSLQVMSDETGEGYKTIQRLITIAKLPDELLKLIDEKQLGIRQGMDLVDLKEDEQRQVYHYLTENKIKPTMTQSAELKQLSREGRLSEEEIGKILDTKKAPTKADNYNPIAQKKSDTYEDTIYKIFSGTGILSHNEETDGYGIKRDGEWLTARLQAGSGLRVFIGGRWIDTSIERNSDQKWCLTGTGCVGNLENIIVDVGGV